MPRGHDTAPVPKPVAETIAALRAERLPLAARLDAIDLAIDNLSRVYGLHGSPQPLPLERRQVERCKPRALSPRAVADAGIGSEASQRRDLILGLLTKAPHGLTIAELRKATPKMDDKDRSNALSVLRLSGKIARSGNAWLVKEAA